MQIYTKFANFTVLYFPHFTTIHNQTLQFYSLVKMLFPAIFPAISCCLDQNFVYSWNQPFHPNSATATLHPLPRFLPNPARQAIIYVVTNYAYTFTKLTLIELSLLSRDKFDIFSLSNKALLSLSFL
jgi:hypothetical protein